MSDHRTKIISSVEFGADPRSTVGRPPMRCRVAFDGGVFVASFMPNPFNMDSPPEAYTKIMAVEELTAQFRRELERALGLNP